MADIMEQCVNFAFSFGMCFYCRCRMSILVWLIMRRLNKGLIMTGMRRDVRWRQEVRLIIVSIFVGVASSLGVNFLFNK